ncbi:hypothetical protein EC973_005559 [Apophysomyces ossiformis]|uniref:Uncharacterized protein n=1 Tax=Apophysomyces ossiformis TaxID=679940 RepID=A0A8H7BP41_9FUNG|nr:hypothetical protein EC973_005559 [Apophysomyces ossiformis]
MSITPIPPSSCKVKSREPHRRTTKEVSSRALSSSYGSVPKRRKRTKSDHSVVVVAPYPFFATHTTDTSSPSSSILSSLFNLFSSSTPSKSPLFPVGFMPRSPQESSVSTCPLDVFAPSTPITIGETEDACSCMSTNSSNSSNHSNAAGPCDEIAISNHINNTTTESTIALSDILCEHYVQQTVMMMDDSERTGDADEGVLIDVPLATFRTFEATPSPEEDEQSFLWQSPDRDWTLVDKVQGEEPKKTAPATTMNTRLRPPSKQYIPICAESPVHVRDKRSNAAHLRMLVAEVNMMRAQKIVGPLRPRSYLNKRPDRFVPHRPSRLCIVEA